MDADQAIELAPPGSYVLSRGLELEVMPGVRVRTCSIRTPTGVLIPLDATLPNGGRLKLLAEVDVESYQAALAYAKSKGGLPSLAALLERWTGHRAAFSFPELVSLELRPVLAR